MMRNIGIVGRKRSGKDTAAQALVEELGYTRHGLADPLKDAALKLDPVIDFVDMGTRDTDRWVEPLRLSEVVQADGWERAKDEYPEVRRTLQRLGDEAGRQVHGEETWILNLLRRVASENEAGRPVVVPDVRYPNEASWLLNAGFLVVRVDRPGFSTPAPGEHASEQVERLAVDAVIHNDSTVSELKRQVIALAQYGPCPA